MRLFPFRGLAAAASRSSPCVSSSSGIPCSESSESLSESLAIATSGPVEVIATQLDRTDVEVDRREGPSTPVATGIVGMPKVSERGRPAGAELPVAQELLRPLNLLFLSLVSISDPYNDVVWSRVSIALECN
jgi:hypothetical protein